MSKYVKRPMYSKYVRSKVAWKRLKAGRPRPTLGRSLLYNNPKQAYKIKRTATGTSAQYYFTNGIANTYRAWSFSLDQLPNFTEFTNLFDSYRIDKIVMRFIAVHAQQVSAEVNNAAAVTVTQPRVYTVIDYDDDAVPTSITELTQYSNCKIRQAGKSFKVILQPKVAVQVYRSAVTTAYAAPDKGTKLDCAYADVPHFGVKLAMTSNATNGYFGYDVNVDYYCSFFGIR